MTPYEQTWNGIGNSAEAAIPMPKPGLAAPVPMPKPGAGPFVLGASKPMPTEPTPMPKQPATVSNAFVAGAPPAAPVADAAPSAPALSGAPAAPALGTTQANDTANTDYLGAWRNTDAATPDLPGANALAAAAADDPKPARLETNVAGLSEAELYERTWKNEQNGYYDNPRAAAEEAVPMPKPVATEVVAPVAEEDVWTKFAREKELDPNTEDPWTKWVRENQRRDDGGPGAGGSSGGGTGA